MFVDVINYLASLSGVLYFLAVLSLLIFVHELGHFLGAKACGVYVDRFSIGLPPRLFGKRIGETDYCVQALPIGGYVKMAGQEDSPVSEEEREKDYGHVPPDRWFNKKPVWQRFIVLVAGPLMNLALAVVLYGLIAAIGSEIPEWEAMARIGEVEADSPAASAPLWHIEEGKDFAGYAGTPDDVGWETGDLVLSLDGREVDSIKDLAIGAILGGEGTDHHLVIDRTDERGATTRYVSRAAPARFTDGPHPRFGVAPYETARIGKVYADSPAEAAGIQAGDDIIRANGKRIDRGTFIALVADTPAASEIDLTVLSGGAEKQLKLRPRTVGRLRHLAFKKPEKEDDSRPVVLAVDKEYAEKTGIQRKDVLLEVNGEPATLAMVKGDDAFEADSTINVKVQRPAILFGYTQKAEVLELELPVDAVRAIGVGLEAVKVFQKTPLPRVVPEAFRQSYIALERTLVTIKALASRDVSPKDIGGPVMIFEVTTAAAGMGWHWLINITAFISINLCVFNLLPLPILDGGQIVLNMVEGLRGKPVSMKAQEIYQQVGLVLIVALMIFVTWNDVGRIIDGLKP